MTGLGRGWLRRALISAFLTVASPLSGQQATVAEPGAAGYPQFEEVPGGVRAFWAPGAGATAYRTTGNRIAPEVVSTTERLLPASFRGLFCTLSTNAAGYGPNPPGACSGYPREDAATPAGGTGSANAEAAWYEFDPSSFETQEAFEAFALFVRPREVVLTSGATYDGTMGKFIRTTYPGTGEVGSPQFELRLPEPEAVKEIWLETWVRMCPQWTGVSDDKILFILEDHTAAGGASQVNRWWFSPRGQGDWYGGPDLDVTDRFFPFTDGTPNQDSEVWDGRWHRLRMHARHPTDERTANGVFEVWWDGRRVESRADANSRTPPLARWAVVAFSMNADPRGCGTRDWGPLRVYSQNPGF